MRPALPALLLLAALGLTGCAGGSSSEDAAPATPSPTGFAQDVRTNFLDSCLDNATNTADGAATEEQLSQTCACILSKVEQEYTQAEFAAFEQRLLGGQASDEENSRLTTWSTDCAAEAAT